MGCLILSVQTDENIPFTTTVPTDGEFRSSIHETLCRWIALRLQFDCSIHSMFEDGCSFFDLGRHTD